MYKRLTCLIFFMIAIQDLVVSSPITSIDKIPAQQPNSNQLPRLRLKARLENLVVPKKEIKAGILPNKLYCGFCDNGPCPERCACQNCHGTKKSKAKAKPVPKAPSPLKRMNTACGSKGSANTDRSGENKCRSRSAPKQRVV